MGENPSLFVRLTIDKPRRLEQSHRGLFSFFLL